MESGACNVRYRSVSLRCRVFPLHDILFFVGVAVDTIAPVIGKVHAGKMQAGSVDFVKALDEAEKRITGDMEEPP